MTSAREANEQMLAEILGIDEEEAARRLNQTVVIKHGDDPNSNFLASELKDQLERTITVVPPGTGADLEIAIGTPPSGNAPKVLYAGVNGDNLTVSKISEIAVSVDRVHPLKIAIAGCYAAAPALHELLCMREAGYREREPFMVSFQDIGLTDDLLAQQIVLEDAVLAGAGAIGNGFLRAIRHLSVTGGLTVVDPKKVGNGNSNRCLYFVEDDIGELKAPLLCLRAQPDMPALVLAPEVKTFHELVGDRKKIKRVFVATDSPRVRRNIQNDLSLEVLDASTTDIREIQLHSHCYPTSGACLECIYQPNPAEMQRERDIAAALGISLETVAKGFIDAEAAIAIADRYPHLSGADLVGTSFDSQFRRLCGENKITNAAGAQILAPFCFVSNLAGALLALELLRFEAGLTDTNIAVVSPWVPPHSRVRRWYAKHPNCRFCHAADVPEAMNHLWGLAL